MSVVDDPSTSILGTTLVVLFASAGLAGLALAGLRGRGRAAEADDPTVLLAGAAGLTSLVGAALAIELGGPGALVWLWIAALLGVGVGAAEGALSRARATDKADEADEADEPPRLFAGFGGAAPVFAGAHALALAFAAIAVGALLHGHQLAAIAREVAHVEPWAVSVALAVVAAPLVLRTGPSRQVGRALFAALGLFVAASLAALFADLPAASAGLARALDAAFTADAARGGLSAGAFAGLTHAVLRAAMSGLGLGLAGDRPATARSMLTPSLSLAVIGTLSALLMLARGTDGRLAVAEPVLFPLEIHQSRGLLPSERGQTFIVPEGSPLVDGKRYAMILRADPRGHKLGQLLRDENLIALPHWQIAAHTDTVIFRSADRRRAMNPGYDVVVPCIREVKAAPSGREYLKLTPRDPAVNFRALINSLDLDGPYLVVDDYPFEAAVERAISAIPSIGEHLALYQTAASEEANGRDNPALRELLTAGMRGPYLADEAEPLPDALIAAPGYMPAIGEVVHLRFEAPARGLDIGFLNRTHDLETPAWDFLAAADTAILRSKTDPALDLRIPVHGRLVGSRLRFTSALPGFSFADVAAIASHEGPFLAPPPYAFAVEVHGDRRLPAQLAGRRTLIPLAGDPRSAAAPRHPGVDEVLPAGMEGPFLDADGAGALAIAWRQTLGDRGALAPALAAALLALVGLWAWAGIGARAIRDLLGAGAGLLYRPLVLLACGLAGGVGLHGLLDLVDLSTILAGQLALLGLLVGLPRALAGRRRR